MIIPILRNGTMAPSLVSIPLLFMCTVGNAYQLSDRPTLKYGTAWKKEATADLVEKAIKAGFRHFDTACQPRHYNEAGVGEGWVIAARSMNLDRKDLWLQSKFSGLNAHDPDNVPYDVNAPLEDRVRQSLAKSLENLKTNYLDSWIMYGPEDNWDDHWKVSDICMHTCTPENKRQYLMVVDTNNRCGEQWNLPSMRERYTNWALQTFIDWKMCNGCTSMQESNPRLFRIGSMPIRVMMWRFERSARIMILSISRKKSTFTLFFVLPPPPLLHV